jgi:hypothetical protein
MKLMKKIEELEEKNHKLEGMKIMLFIQTQRQLVQLQRYEAMDMREPNIISETLVCVSTQKKFLVVSPYFTHEYVSL